ncbi:STAS domain-containing protein [Zoogloea oleivorans]|uniref:STAS domain-containing protein n=2 Tax=Zoogloea oleivorans TaxID=1552750 RepID=A0A6C2D109_9RHOO|nr:STAS domain-containing protein [Zoogloea sp.]MBT9497340.1 STAS domain-containing protein [Zoogloea sp.]TYC60218.1 STAS domain-containing protein [Zoogloea oleivorans]
MALPFFGKKPVPAGSPSPRPRTSSGAAASPVSSSAKSSRSSTPRNETSSLDFTIAGGDLSRVLAQCADKVHVEEGVDEMTASVEEAAIVYANGCYDEARGVLEQALATTTTADARYALWGMLLDLFRLTGQKERFESRSLIYATEFERSPPAWHDLSPQATRTGEAKVQTVNLSGTLSGQAAAQFVQLIQIGMRNGALRIDLTRLRGVDNAGAELLLRAVRGLRKARIKLSLVGAGHLASVLGGQVANGRRENQTTWLLLLEVLQYTDQQERFEELAVEYAMTFEESPPSWEPPPAATASQIDAAVLAVEMTDIYVLEGEILGPNTEALRKITAFAASRNKVEVDCSRLRRMDFVSAGTLFNIVSQLHTQGRLVVLKGVNSMVAALMQVMGLHQVARIELRD